AAFAERFVEHDHVEKRKRLHVADLGKLVETHGPGLSVEVGDRNPRAMKFGDADAVEQGSGKIRREHFHLLAAERACQGTVLLALRAQAGSDPFDTLRDLLLGWMWKDLGSGRGLGHLVNNSRVELVQCAGSVG